MRGGWLRHCAKNRTFGGWIPVGVRIFHWHNPSGRTMVPGVDSASNRNEYQEYFLRGKGGRCWGLKNSTIFMCRFFSKSLNLNLLEPSGSVRASRRIDFPFNKMQRWILTIRKTLFLKISLRNFDTPVSGTWCPSPRSQQSTDRYFVSLSPFLN